MSETKRALRHGMRDGVPIALGYFAVSFSLGIAARNAGLTPLEGFFASLFTTASAGEHAVFSLIGAGTTVLEVILITLIASGRYLLMSCALSQRLSPDTPFFHRLLIGADVTDEEAYTIAATIFENVEAIAQQHAKGNELDLAYASECGLPYHAGAAKYFAEKGITVQVAE